MSSHSEEPMTDANTNGARMVAACTSGDEATVRELLRETPSLAPQVLVGPLAPLHYAVREGHASIVQLLLQHGADAHVVVENLWRIPLRTVDVAAARGFSEVGALIDKAIEAALWSLFRASGNAELLRVFLEAGANANVNDGGCTLLHYLTADPDTKPSIEVLLQFKANINARDSFFRFTPLTWAVVQRRLDMVQFLLAHGAAIELPDDQPWTTPRFWATHLEEPAVMQALAG